MAEQDRQAGEDTLHPYVDVFSLAQECFSVPRPGIVSQPDADFAGVYYEWIAWSSWYH
jgi:hypothetical protein